MNFDVPNFVSNFLSNVDAEMEPIGTISIGSTISQLRKDHMPLPEEQQAGAWVEMSAFNFYASHSRDESVWGTYFGPMASWSQQDGSQVHAPNLEEVDADVVDYWSLRVGEVNHPVLKARYADLVWDLTYRVTQTRPDIQFVRTAIDAYLEAISKSLYDHVVVGIEYCERALFLAISVSDKSRIEAAKDAMFELYEKIAVPKQGGTWPFLFDNLYANRRVELTLEEEARIIDLLEKILAKCADFSNKENFSPFEAKEAAFRLARHYGKLQDEENVKRVTLAWGKAFEQVSNEASPMLAMTWLQPVFEEYTDRGYADDAQRVQLASRAKGAEQELREVSVPVKIAKDELDRFFEAITEGKITEATRQVVSYFIPKVKEAQKYLTEFRENFPLVSLISVSKISEGQIIATAGDIGSDPEGRLALEIDKSIRFQAPFLSGSLERLREKFELSTEDLLNVIFLSPIFSEDRRSLIAEGVEAWLKEDHCKSVHILIPQIEHALRKLLALLGLPTNKRLRTGAMQEKNLGDILQDVYIKEALGEDIVTYFRVLFVDQRGYNLRNVVCHGLAPSEFFDKALADRVVHAFLVLSLVRKTES